MHESIIFAAPVLIAGIVMAVRFVGCGLDTQGLESPQPYSTAILPTPGLVSFWQLNDTSLAKAVDSGPGSNRGKYNGGVTLSQPGLVNTDTTNTAAKFDGSSGYVSVPFAAGLNPAKFTVEAIVNPSAVGNGDGTDYHAIVSSRNLAGSAKNTSGYILYLHGSSFEAWIGDNTPQWQPENLPAGPPGLAVTAKAVKNDGPYYVAMTYDGTKLTLYVNPTGDDTDPDQVNSATVTYDHNTATEFRIGAGANEQAATYFFPGLIQDVALYNVALDSTTVLSHCSIMLTGYSP